jgi:hypothetical protein
MGLTELGHKRNAERLKVQNIAKDICDYQEVLEKQGEFRETGNQNQHCNTTQLLCAP